MTAYEMRMSDWSSDVCSSDLGWIPEAVFTTASVTPGRKTLHFDTPDFGAFSFHPLAIADYRFLIGVDRVQMGKLTAFVAQPLRALMDLVALRKEQWSGASGRASCRERVCQYV